MATELLPKLYDAIEDDLDGLTMTADGLRAVVDGRFGEVAVAIDHDDEAEMIRVSAAVPPPVGSGRSFLVWCLSINARYWDVKIGLSADGQLLVHADLDAGSADLDDLAAAVVERTDTVVDLLDDDLVEWLLEHGMGTPEQRERWESRQHE